MTVPAAFSHPLFIAGGLLFVAVLVYDAMDLARLLKLIARREKPGRLAAAGLAPEPAVDVVIPIYNMGRTFARCLESIERSAYPKRRIIVVDDGSDDGETEVILRGLADRIDVLARIPHGGKAAAANHGASLGRGEVILILDADSYVVADFIEQTLAELAPEVGAIDFVQQVANPGESFWTRAAAFERELLTLVPDNFGALFAIRRADFEAGPFHDCLSPQFEINDRLRRAGRLRISPRPVVFSDEPASLRRTYRRKRRWMYGWLQSRRRHGEPVDFHLFMPALDVLLVALILPAPVLPALALFPLGLALAWAGKSLWLARRLGLALGTALTYPAFMLVLCVAAVEASLRFLLDRRVAWI